MVFKKGNIPWHKGKKGVYSSEQLGKMSESHKGKISWNKGIPMRKESRKKLSDSLRGKPSPNKGKTFSEETRKKLSLSHLGIRYPNRRYSPEQGFQKGHKINLGRHFPPEFGRKIVETRRKNDSYKPSEEAKRKMSESQKKRLSNPEVRKRLSEAIKHYFLNPEARKRMSEATKSVMASPKARKRLSEATKGRHLSPKSEFKKGHKLSEESVRRRTEKISGEKSYLWKGGISFEPYSLEWTRALKKAIRERDSSTCQICFNKGNQVHHIDYNKKNCNPENLITLCRSCHTKTNQHREKWEKLLKENEPTLWEIEVPIINGDDKETIDLLEKLNNEKKKEFEGRKK